MSDPASEDEIRFSDDEEIEKADPVNHENEFQEEEMEEMRKEREKELKELHEKEKKQPEVNTTQFLIREGYTTEHRVAIMNREVKYLMSLGKFTLALPICCDAIQLNQSPLSYLNRAHIYKSLKRYEDAIADFTTVIVNDTLNTAASLCQRGICYSKLYDYDNAIDDLNKSYQLEPSFSTSFNRGFILAESGNHEAAVLDYNNIVDNKIDGELRSRTIYHRALSFVNLKRYDDAKFDLRSILLKDPNALAPRVLLSKAYKFTGHFVQSEECLNQCITKDCDQAELFIERSYIRCRLGSNHNLKEAYKDLTKAMAIYVREYDEERIKEKKKRYLELTNAAAATQSAVTRGRLNKSMTSPDNLPRLTAANLHLSASPRAAAAAAIVKQNSLDIRHTLSRHSSSAGSVRSGSKPNSRPSSSSAMKRQKSVCNSSTQSLLEPTSRKGSNGPSLSRKDSTVSSKEAVAVQSTIEYFGSIKIASVYAKMAQILNLMQFDFTPQRSNFDIALENAEKAMKICPENSTFTMTYLTCLLRLSKYDEASSLLDKILAEDSLNKKALYYKAFCYRAVNDPYNAVDCLTKILTLSMAASKSGKDTDTDADDELLDGASFLLRVLEMRGLLLHEQKAYKFALADFGRAICIDATRPGNFYFRGNCHSKLGNFELAIEDFCLAEECKFPNLPFLLMCKGVVLRLVGDNKGAIEEFDRAITGIDDAKGERDISVKLLLCRVYIYKSLSFINIKQYRKALDNLLQISEAVDGTLRNRKKSHMARHGAKIGLVTVKPGESFEEVIDPSLRWLVSYHIALSHYMLQEYPKCMKMLKVCLGVLRKHVPDDIALGSCIFFYCVAACLVYKSTNPEEELFMQKCVDMLGECLDTDWCRVKDYNMMLCQFALGKCHQRLERHEEAIHHFSEAKKMLEETNEVISYVYFRRAWSYKALSQYTLAAEDFESAKMLKLNDPNFSINYRKINDIAYIEIDNEPDTIEEFMPIFPSFDA